MKIRPEEITSILKQRIESYDVDTDLAEVGTVLQVGDGLARVYGLENCLAGELLELEHGVTGIAFNLEEDNVGCPLFGDWELVTEGEPVKRTGKVVEHPRRRRPRRPRRQPARRAARRARADQDGRDPPARVQGAGRRAAPARGRARPDRHQGDRLDDPDRPRPARADHRRPLDRQDGAPHRHDPEPERPGRDLRLRRHRPEGLDGRAGLRAPEGRGRDGLHDHRRRLRDRGRADQVDGAVRRRRDGRALPLLGPPRALHVRRPLQARGRLPADVAPAAPPARAARRSRATSSTSTRGCSSARASSRTTSAAARSPRCR